MYSSYSHLGILPNRPWWTTTNPDGLLWGSISLPWAFKIKISIHIMDRLSGWSWNGRFAFRFFFYFIGHYLEKILPNHYIKTNPQYCGETLKHKTPWLEVLQCWIATTPDPPGRQKINFKKHTGGTLPFFFYRIN